MPSDNSVALVQNPAFGALLLWSFGRGFQTESVGNLPHVTSYFLVLPLLLHGPTFREIRGTNVGSGLSKLVTKLTEEREQLLSIHNRTHALRDLTLQSLGCAIATKLVRLDYDSACVRSNEVKPPTPPERLKFHVAGADKLGRWFARLPQAQVFSLLQVDP